MAKPADPQIREMLTRFDVPYDGNVWHVQDNPVIAHKALELVAARAEIEFDKPTIIRAERDEAVILVHGHCTAKGNGTSTKHEWSIGEALIDVNYRVSGRQAAYVWAMAEKRAKDRVILKLVNLHGLAYSEEEADDFREGRPQQSASKPKDGPKLDFYGNAMKAASHYTAKLRPRSKGPRLSDATDINTVTDALMENMKGKPDPDALKAWAKGQESQFKSLPDLAFDEVMDAYEQERASLVAERTVA